MKQKKPARAEEPRPRQREPAIQSKHGGASVMTEANKRPIIVIKKKGGHGGHHGGAWKVAYADFVTAMMALFIVLWLMNSSQKIQVAVSGYFKDPSGTGKEVGSSLAGSGEKVQLPK